MEESRGGRRGRRGCEKEKIRKESARRNRGSERDIVTERGSVPRDPRETEERHWKRRFKQRRSLQLDNWNPKPG